MARLLRNQILAGGVSLFFGACASSAVPVGTATVGTYTFDIAREGDAPAAGVSTRWVLKPTTGGNPTSIMAWVAGDSTESPTKVLAVYDPADGDFDADVTAPTPMPGHAKLWFDVDTSGLVLTGSVDVK